MLQSLQEEPLETSADDQSFHRQIAVMAAESAAAGGRAHGNSFGTRRRPATASASMPRVGTPAAESQETMMSPPCGDQATLDSSVRGRHVTRSVSPAFRSARESRSPNRFRLVENATRNPGCMWQPSIFTLENIIFLHFNTHVCVCVCML